MIRCKFFTYLNTNQVMLQWLRCYWNMEQMWTKPILWIYSRHWWWPTKIEVAKNSTVVGKTICTFFLILLAHNSHWCYIILIHKAPRDQLSYNRVSELLIKGGADVNKIDDYGMTVLQHAAQYGQFQFQCTHLNQIVVTYAHKIIHLEFISFIQVLMLL